QDGRVLEVTTQVGERELVAVRRLEEVVVAHDGGRLKLEPAVLASGRVEAALWWAGEQLLGFAALYDFGPPDVEIAGMVAPQSRRQRIGTAMLDALLPRARERGFSRALLVTPAATSAGRAFAEWRAAELSHSEHFLALGSTPEAQPVRAGLSTRSAVEADLETLSRLLGAAFGSERLADNLRRDLPATQVIELDGVPVGTLRLERDEERVGIYGFAVDPAWQGQGIGREVLGMTCRDLRADGGERVTLEVETENAHALGLYTALGFVPEAGEDYWALGL
ncbi:MAG: GNAT family N-acetyltransferase, partial [Actinomycetota bacterium]|nr:GNAT family N-acetyltransferase [Actinomycetota bacterium]